MSHYRMIRDLSAKGYVQYGLDWRRLQAGIVKHDFGMAAVWAHIRVAGDRWFGLEVRLEAKECVMGSRVRWLVGDLEFGAEWTRLAVLLLLGVAGYVWLLVRPVRVTFRWRWP